MTKKHSTKKALLASVLSLLLCVSMLIGTTFAWFTDSVTSTGNKIVSGSLNIDLSVMDETGEYQSVKENSDAIFDYNLWEPGYTVWKNIKVSTTGNLALKYAINIVLKGERSILANVIDVYYAASEIDQPDDRSLTGLTRLGTISEVLDGATGALINDTLIPGTNAADYATIVLKMQESANNDYQGKTIGEFDINLFATQYTYEEDSFGADYDDAAWVVANADVTAGTASELSDALKEGGLIALTDNINGNITLDEIADDTVLNFAGKTINGTVTVAEGQSITINGNGGITAEGSNPAVKVGKNADVTLSGGTLTSESGAAVAIANAKTEVPMKLTIEDGTTINSPTLIGLDVMNGYAGAEIEINGGDFTATASGSYVRPINVNGGHITINGGTFEAPNATSYCYFIDVGEKYNTETGTYDVGSVTINGGEFRSTANYCYVVAGSINTSYTANRTPGTVTINGGTFEMLGTYGQLTNVGAHVVVNDCMFVTKGRNVFSTSYNNDTDRAIEVKGGTFSVKPAGDHVTIDGTLTQNADGTWTVS